MEKLITVVFPLILLLSSCTMSDEEILKRAEEIKAKNSTPTPTMPQLQSQHLTYHFTV